jgi:hypothetical protein
MRRREFIELMGGLTATSALKPAFAQWPLKLIVWISAFPFAPERPFPTLFLKGMQEQGYVKGSRFRLCGAWRKRHYRHSASSRRGDPAQT